MSGAEKVFPTIGVRNFAKSKRDEHDFYATDPLALDKLLDLIGFEPNVWECACGQGHLSEVLKKHGYTVFSSDIINRGYEDAQIDFLRCKTKWDGAIITNPPYKQALQFVKKALEVVCDGNHVVVFLRLLFLETKARGEFFKVHPPKWIYVSRSRVACAKGGNFEENGKNKALCYAWFIWEKGFTGEPTIRWFN